LPHPAKQLTLAFGPRIKCGGGARGGRMSARKGILIAQLSARETVGLNAKKKKKRGFKVDQRRAKKIVSGGEYNRG